MDGDTINIITNYYKLTMEDISHSYDTYINT